MNGALSTRVCRQCSREFHVNLRRHFQGKFCSIICRNRFLAAKSSAENPRRKPCPVCGAEFVAKGGQKTCSMKCKLEKGRGLRARKCSHCGKDFSAPVSTARRKFCSLKCHTQSRLLRLPVTNCLSCGIELRAHANSRPRKYCSKECQYAHKVGSNHHLWRGNRRQERGPTWLAQSRSARERDGVCVAIDCGKSSADLGQRLSVDHIVPYRMTVVYGKKDGLDPNHLDNLACLCRVHHGAKTQAESRLLEGDVMGFRREMRTLLPDERVQRALSLWRLG